MPRLFIACLFAALLAAQDKPIVIAANTILDGRGQILRNTRIVIQNGRILRIDPKAAPITEGRAHNL